MGAKCQWNKHSIKGKWGQRFEFENELFEIRIAKIAHRLQRHLSKFRKNFSPNHFLQEHSHTQRTCTRNPNAHSETILHNRTHSHAKKKTIKKRTQTRPRLRIM